MALQPSDQVKTKLKELEPSFHYWEKTKDLIDQLIDIILNYRQSGHPGGSRSKVHAMLTLMLSGIMRWDIRDPNRKFADRFILAAGHTIPMIYCTLAVLNEAMHYKFNQTGDKKYALPSDKELVLFWEDLLDFRHVGGLSGHAEMEGKTLFLKFNTGASGHGSAPAVGEALTLKRAGVGEVKVFAIEGEGGLTAGVNHEAMNTAYGLALDNLYFIVDWNDFGIDDHPISKVVYGTPEDWFSAHGWNVFGTEKGENWESITGTFLNMVSNDNPNQVPSMAWTKTRKGRGYLKYDNASHGSPHAKNSDLFWETKKPFMEKYGVNFTNYRVGAPDLENERAEFKANLNAVIEVLYQDQELVDYLTDTLVEIADSIPNSIKTFRLGKNGNPFKDKRIYDFKNYPPEIYVKPGEKYANRNALLKWGAWINAFGSENYGQPLVIACSADLCQSTNVSGFGDGFGNFKGYGWYERKGNSKGALLPQAITEMVNAGLLTGMATVNFADEINNDFLGFWGACSTYGSFAYLKYGMMRLFSQLAQDCQWKVGKVIWISGHSGPETADDSRTHFGIFSPLVSQLFPKGHIINIHPWEYNEVPVLLGAALSQDVPIIALHLTRPPIEIPDRKKLSMPSHFEAAKGAYIVREYKKDVNRGGTIFIQGTSAMTNIVKILPELDECGLNVKLVYVSSPELFALQSVSYRQKVVTQVDRADSTIITTRSRRSMNDWMFNDISNEYALSSDWDNRWRTGGTLDEILEEAHLSHQWLLSGIKKFVKDRSKRLARIKLELDAALQVQE